jgi:hypothetical protein
MNCEQFYALGLGVAQQVQRETGLDMLTFHVVDTPWNCAQVHGTLRIGAVAQTYALPSGTVDLLLQLPEAVVSNKLRQILEAAVQQFRAIEELDAD